MDVDSNKFQFTIRKAEPQDSKQVYQFMKDLCIFLKSGDEMSLTQQDFHADIFSENPVCLCIVVTTVEEPAKILGYSLYYPVYSAWKGLTMYMEDLYVDTAHRGKGLGKMLWQKVTQIALDMGCRGLRLSVENWNKNAKEMYTRFGCTDLTEGRDEHIMYHSKDAMEKFVLDHH